VILDDLLIQSDDLRASAALQVLAEFAQRTQVLFFTHHSRLADLGLKAGASVIHLQPSAASAVGAAEAGLESGRQHDAYTRVPGSPSTTAV
jgi:hypothetical protein